MTTISDRLQVIREQIEIAARNCSRNPDEIGLIAVSKTHPAEAIRAAFDAGQRIFGENYVQEALKKMPVLADLNIEWHFIGPIQSNKTRAIATHFDWVHGVDRAKIADRLNESRTGYPLNVCIQVNVSREISKSGCMPDETAPLAHHIATLPHLKLRGLMTVPEATLEKSEQCRQFSALRKLYQQLIDDGFALDSLSMGMSGDYDTAIAEGATLVRIGTAIFGQRHYSQEST